MPYWKMPLVGMSGRPSRIGSGITPGAPEIGCPPPSYISDRLIARRAPFGQNEALPVMIASLLGGLRGLEGEAGRLAALEQGETIGEAERPEGRGELVLGLPQMGPAFIV